jgi:uroporphyrinogen-III decarboxylase
MTLIQTGLSSRERLLCAMRGQQPDHVPLWNLWRNEDVPFTYRDQVDRAEAVLGLGLDDTLLLEPPLNKTEHYDVNRVEGISTRIRREIVADERYPVLSKEYLTAGGSIRQVVRQTEDWPYGDEIRFFSDYNVPRSIEFAVKAGEDLRALRYILGEPSLAQVQEFRGKAAILRNEARRLQVVLEGGWSALGDAALWLLGAQALLVEQMDHSDLVEELLEIICQWELKRIELLLDEKVEVIVHSAWYESTNFWSPRTFRKLVKPRLKRLVDLTHQAGALFSYIITSAWLPIADDLVEAGIDNLLGVDPIQDKIDLEKVKQKIGGKVCLWGGVNGAVTLGNGSVEEVRRETRRAIQILAPGGGFVLYPVDQLVKETPWKNVLAMIDTWKSIAIYPTL